MCLGRSGHADGVQTEIRRLGGHLTLQYALVQRPSSGRSAGGGRKRCREPWGRSREAGLLGNVFGGRRYLRARRFPRHGNNGWVDEFRGSGVWSWGGADYGGRVGEGLAVLVSKGLGSWMQLWCCRG